MTTSSSPSTNNGALFQTNVDLEVVEKFDDFGLKEELLRGIYGYGWERPSPIQQRAIIPMVQGNDLIAQAQSGTGKSGAFLVSSFQVIDPSVSATQILLLAPTRELALQHSTVATQLSLYMPNLKVHLSNFFLDISQCSFLCLKMLKIYSSLIYCISDSSFFKRRKFLKEVQNQSRQKCTIWTEILT